MGLVDKVKSWFAPLPQDETMKREMWPSRAAFLLASIGSSVGLGNIWRFPGLAYSHGGGAFFVPYLVALFILGIPLLALELSLGKLFRSGDIVAFSRVSHRLRGLGLASIFGAFVINTYYTVLMAWIMVYFFQSFFNPLPWTVTNPDIYFKQDILMLPSDGRQTNPQILVGHSFGTLLTVWVLVYFCLWKGVQLTGKIAYVTMTLPVIFIFVICIRGATLPGAASGIHDYIGQFDASKLSNPLIWSEAVGQIFFSIGIGVGCMTAYASYNSSYQNTAVDSVIIALSNSVYEIFCGFAVFSIVGYMRQQGMDTVAVSSFGLAFSTYPIAFSSLPGSNFWCILFFLTLFILGIDSGFSLIESGVTCLMDSRRFGQYKRETIVAVICTIGFLIGTMYITEVGLYIIDAVDYFLNNIAIVFIGMMECVGASFFYKFHEVESRVGRTSIWLFDLLFASGLIVGCGVGVGLNPLAGLFLGSGLISLGIGLSMFFANPELSFKQQLWWILLGNIELLRTDINATDTKGHVRMPLIWSICIKFLNIPILFLVLCVPFGQMNSPTVPSAYRWLGILIVVLSMLFIAVGLVLPQWFEWAMPEDDDEQESLIKNEIEVANGDIELAETRQNSDDDQRTTGDLSDSAESSMKE
jgi:solute carrier family 6 (neurotransmitter transporter, GABA) member 1